jgi:hypothetical protein
MCISYGNYKSITFVFQIIIKTYKCMYIYIPIFVYVLKECRTSAEVYIMITGCIGKIFFTRNLMYKCRNTVCYTRYICHLFIMVVKRAECSKPIYIDRVIYTIKILSRGRKFENAISLISIDDKIYCSRSTSFNTYTKLILTRNEINHI